MRIPTLTKIICLPLALAALFGCSNGSGSSSTMVDASGKHPANWLQQHWVFYRQANGGSKDVSSTTPCSECHGVDLTGGNSKVSCFSDSFQGMFCHNNPDHTLGHPTGWGSDPSSQNFHAFSAYNGQPVKGNTNLASSSSCGLCHSAADNTVLVGDSPSCLSTTRSIGCHSSSPAAQPSSCVSCHGTPPDGNPPAGNAAPNRAGDHAAHLSLAGVTCGTCHFSFGTMTQKHAGGKGQAFLNLSAPYRAQSGTFSYTGGSCAAVSCHGGKPSPNWTTGETINVSTDCAKCHQLLDPQAPQYNSYFSGTNTNVGNLHQFHLAQLVPGLGRQIFCTDCHNTAVLASKHFSGLATHTFELAPALTVAPGAGTLIVSDPTNPGGYDAVTSKCFNSCHVAAGIPNNLVWKQ